ncbi:MAG: restriction endonuclease [Methyloprofundus sp.]|nr:restriction endonuclease [Methyloprofundus sp.]
MRIEKAEERQEIDIPISEIVHEGGKLNILPNVKNYFSIDYKPKNDKLSLVAGGFIGLIPINNELAIQIKPKFSISNLTRIVAVAEDNFNTLSFFSKKYQENENFSPVVFEFMAECLANELQTLEAEGLLKDYLLKKEESHKIRGRINVNDSIKSLWSHGHFNKASISFFDFTPDNPFNRLIKFTLKFCIEELNLINSPKNSLRQSLIEYYSIFDAVSLDHSLHCFDDVFSAIESDKVTALRKYYVNICEICRLIVNRTGVSFDEDGDDIDLNSFTLDMATTFEKYLLNSIRINREIFPENTVILDGNKEGRKKLYNQPSIGKGDAKPDIILKAGINNTKIIADAKYKTKSKDTDRYQVISHALSYNAKIAVLILPKEENYTGNRLIKLGSVGIEPEINVYEYYYDLSSYDLMKEERRLSYELLDLFTKHSAALDDG